jgi:alkylhydroperoxidase family enzyme
MIGEDFETSELPPRYKLVVRYADVLIHDPAAVDDELRRALLDEFSPVEIVELTATITVAMGFSKAAIAWGPPPTMPVTTVPTPAPGASVA